MGTIYYFCSSMIYIILRMYNYHQFQRQQQLNCEFRSTYSSFLAENTNRKVQNQVLNSNHKKRVDAFVLSAIESPIEVSQRKETAYDPRSILKSIKPISTTFRMNSHTTSQRLQTIVQKNSYLDAVPFQNTNKHKFRDATPGHVQAKPFKFTASCSAVRIMDKFILDRTNEVAGFEPKKSKNIMKVRREIENFEKENRKLVDGCKLDSQSQISESINNQKSYFRVEIKPNMHMKSVQRVVMPSLHRKTYFNSMKAVMVEPPPPPTIFTEGSESERQGIGKDIQQKSMKSKANDHLTRRQNAQNAMIRCKVIKFPHNGTTLRS